MKIVRNEKSYSTEHNNKPKTANSFKQPFSLDFYNKKELLKNATITNSLHYLYPLQSDSITPETSPIIQKSTKKQVYLHRNHRHESTQQKPKHIKQKQMDNNITTREFQPDSNAQMMKSMSILGDSINKLSQHFENLTNQVNNNTKMESQISKINTKIDSLLSLKRNENSEFNKFNFKDFGDCRYENLGLEIGLLPIRGQQRKYKIEQFLGKACKKVFSTGFGLLASEKLSVNAMKAFCSEQLLNWIIQISKKNLMTASDLAIINKCLVEKILPYFSYKYPASNEGGDNSQLSSLIVERKNIEENENDFLSRNGMEIRYKSSGNYNTEIMKVINKILNVSREKKQYQGLFYEDKNKKENFYERFREDMATLFKKVENKEEVDEMQSYQINKTIFDEDIMSLIKRGSFNQDFDNIRGTFRRSTYINADSKSKDDNHHIELLANVDEYRQNVRSYTKYEISKKIKDNIKAYTDKQLFEGDFKLTDSGMIRILTKWTEELESCFKEKATIFREHPYMMRNGQISFLAKHWTIILYKLLQINKNSVDEYRKKVHEHMNQAQFEATNTQISTNLRALPEEESRIGQFSTLMFKNGQAYLKGYLNILIHSICRALDQLQLIARANEILSLEKMSITQIQSADIEELLSKAEHSSFTDQDVSYMIPELISFKVGDIFRCKCSSKEKQITAIYKEMEKMNQEKPHIFKIVRVKNKLKEGTKDILINVLYREKFLVEVQLAIKSDKTKLIQFQSDFKHYLYQLQRGLFGPIHELCNTWVSKDPRADFYLTNFDQQNKRQTVDTEISCSHKDRRVISFPFRCSICQFYYEDPKITNNHIECDDLKCKGRKMCFICQLQSQSTDILSLNILINSILSQTLHKNIFYYKRGQQTKLQRKFPFKGSLINLKKQQNQKIPFVKVEYQQKLYLLEPINEGRDFRLLKEISLNDGKTSLKKFLSENIIIVEMPEILGRYKSDEEIREKIQISYLLPKYFRSCIKEEKNSITLSHKNLENDQIFKCKSGQFKFVKSINLSYNKISSIENIAKKFSNVEILNLSNNQIKKIPQDLTNFALLEKLQLNYNKTLNDIPEQIFFSPSLQLIEIKGCNITKLKLPRSSNHFSRLRTLLVDENYLQQIPDEIQSLENLEYLSATNNRIIHISSKIRRLRFLKHFNVSKNKGIQLPQQIGALSSLERFEAAHCLLQSMPSTIVEWTNMKDLNLSYNHLKQIQFQLCQLQNLQKLNLSNNEIEEVPTEIRNLKNLRELTLQKNPKIKSLPPEIGELKQLKNISLNSQENNLRSIQLPHTFYDLLLQNVFLLNNQVDQDTKKRLKTKEHEGWCIKISEPVSII